LIIVTDDGEFPGPGQLGDKRLVGLVEVLILVDQDGIVRRKDVEPGILL